VKITTSLSFGIAAALWVGVAVVPASATTVTFTTTGSFCTAAQAAANSGACPVGGSNTITSGGVDPVTLTYNRMSTPVPTSAFPSYPSFGNIVASGTSGQSTTLSLVGDDFTLYIDESTPNNISGSFTAALTGTVVYNQSTAYLKFSNNSITLDGATYTLIDGITGQPAGTTEYSITPPITFTHAHGYGYTSISGEVTYTSVTPEPGFLTLTGLGFFGLILAVTLGRFRGRTATAGAARS